MNQDTYQKIVALTPMIVEFQNLETYERAWLEPLLTKTVKTAIAILDSLSEREKTYQEVADDLAINWQTAKQIINALSEGGANIQIKAKAAQAATGRLRVLKRVI